MDAFKLGAALGGLLLMGAATCMAQTLRESLCADTTLIGSAARGDRFEASFGDNLHFVLEPSVGTTNPDGWTIRIIGSNPAHDYLLVATPPYRFSNPRYLDTSYGHSAMEAVAWTPRMFRFVAKEADFERMNEAIAVLLWPAEATQEEINEAKAALETTPTAAGEFRIVSAETSSPTDDDPLGRIEKLSFEVTLCGKE